MTASLMTASLMTASLMTASLMTASLMTASLMTASLLNYSTIIKSTKFMTSILASTTQFDYLAINNKCLRKIEHKIWPGKTN